VFVTLGSFSYGYSASIIASTLGQSHFISYFHLDPAHDPNANALLGATNGLFQTGGLFGALLIGYCADHFSRRVAIIISSAIICIGGALQAASQNITMFLIMRFFTGIGVGLIVGAVPLYQSEISPPHSRGFLVGLHGEKFVSFLNHSLLTKFLRCIDWHRIFDCRLGRVCLLSIERKPSVAHPTGLTGRYASLTIDRNFSTARVPQMAYVQPTESSLFLFC